MSRVGSFANVFITSSAPLCAAPGADVSYTLNFGNNGNLAADAVVITTDFDETELSFVSGTGASCLATAGVINCTVASPLAAAATGTLTLNFTVASDLSFVTSGALLANTSAIATSTTEATLGDLSLIHI